MAFEAIIGESKKTKSNEQMAKCPSDRTKSTNRIEFKKKEEEEKAEALKSEATDRSSIIELI